MSWENARKISFEKFSALSVNIRHQVTQVFASSLLLLHRESVTADSR